MRLKFDLLSQNSTFLAVSPLLFAASVVHANGIEQTNLWSGRYAGMGGAAVSNVEGPESLYFNPAALAGGNGLEGTANFSPTLSKVSGPITSTSGVVNSDTSFSPVGSIFASYKITPQLGIGVGYYVAGGGKASFSSYNFGPSTYTVQNNFTITELSPGIGLEIIDGLRIGVAYRMSNLHADVATAFANPLVNGFTGVALSDMSNTRWNGYRAGIQYAPKELGWGLGAEWRSRVDYTAAGTSVITPTLALPAVTITAPVTASITLPTEISVGGFYDLIPSTWRLALEYNFIDYGIDQTFQVTGGGAPSFPLAWHSMQIGKIGTEYKAWTDVTLRAGYSYTSQVTPNGFANAVYSTPAALHTFNLGAGYQILPVLHVDGALHYAHASGTVAAADIPANSTTLPGVYSGNIYSVHVGVTYSIL